LKEVKIPSKNLLGLNYPVTDLIFKFVTFTLRKDKQQSG